MKFSWYLIREHAGEAGKETSLPFYAILADGQGRSPAIITCREGGFSRRGYQGLNMSLRVGDDPDAVRKNREILFRTLCLREDELARPEQVHESLVLVADAPGDYKTADGIATSKSGLAVAILVADCVPVFVFDRDFSAMGLAHAGRRGTQGGITTNLIKQITSTFDLVPSQLVLALGPSIGPCCYELDSTTASLLPRRFIIEREGRVFFDLWSANATQALEEGILEENIILPPACTCCKKDTFFSHRAQQGKTGRQMAIALPGGFQIGSDMSRNALE